MISIVLADDHPTLRHALRALLEAEGDFLVVGEASDGVEALELVARFEPDVLIVDVMMPEMGGLEVVRMLQCGTSQTRAVVLSMYSCAAYVSQALKHGARGYIVKDSCADELVPAVRQIVAGQRFVSPLLAKADRADHPVLNSEASRVP